MKDTTKYPWKWATMTDAELRIWLMMLVAGKDASRENVKLASAEWPKGADGKPDISRLPPIIWMEHRSDAHGGVWWDFDRSIAGIRKWFPYSPE